MVRLLLVLQLVLPGGCYPNCGNTLQRVLNTFTLFPHFVVLMKQDVTWNRVTEFALSVLQSMVNVIGSFLSPSSVPPEDAPQTGK